MKKILLALLIFSSAISYGLAQTWTRMQSWGSDFEAIYWITEEKGVIVGENLITYTEDGGATWNEVLQKFDYRLKDVLFFDVDRGVAIGENGKLIRTEDGGLSWTEQNSGVSEDLLEIKKTNSGVAYIVGRNGLLLKSSNLGTTWSQISIGSQTDLFSLSIPHEDSIFVSSELGRVYFSINQGNTWSSIQTTFDQNLSSIHVEKKGNWFVAGENGVAGVSIDFGSTFTTFNLSTTSNLTSIISFSSNSERILITGSDGNAFLSTDSGANFSPINYGSNLAPGLNETSISPTGEIFIAGNSGSLIRSENAGNTWTVPLIGKKTDFVSMDMESSSYGFFGGSDGQLYLTTDGAISLTPRPLPEETTLYSLEFWNANYGFVTADSGVTYRTANAGQSWTKLQISTPNAIKGVHIFLTNFPYVVGANGTIARSSGTSGNSWEVFGPNTTKTSADINDISAFDLQTAFAVGDEGKLLWSNNGFVWDSIPTGTTQNLNFSTRINATSAFAVGDAGTALKTTDLGRTWRLIDTGVSENLKGVDFFGDNFAVAAGENGAVIVSYDSGETWETLETGTLQDLNTVFAIGPNDAIAAGKNGTIIKFGCPVPSGRLSAISGPADTCISTQFYSISDQPEPGSNLVWRVDGGTILSGQGTNRIQVVWDNSGRGGVFVNRSNSCGSGETSFIEVKITASPAQDIEIEGDGQGCVGEQNIFTVPTLENHEYIWQATGGEIIQGQNTSTATVDWKEVGLQKIRLEIRNKCGRTTLKEFPVQVSKAPDQTSPISGELIVSLVPEIYEVQNIPGLNYQWTLSGGGQIIEGLGTSRIVVQWEQEGTYNLSVRAQNECNFSPEQTIQVIASVVTSLEPALPESAVKLFPNPSSGSITIESDFLDVFSQITISNALGQIISSKPILAGQTRIYLEGLPKGLNFAVLEGKNGRLIKKILVQ